ncbi:MAG TPA: DUF4332 domain-containing protein [Burkholderiaceae bacterium]|nr:DUF4332 domain-containing protein [Burkholderiaceae bacterium]
MGNIGCCLWWLVFGLLLGFLLYWLLARRGGGSAAAIAAPAGPDPELLRLRADNERLTVDLAEERARTAAVRVDLDQAHGQHMQEHDALYAELQSARADLAREVSAHAADSVKLSAMGASAGAAAYGYVPKMRNGEDDLAIVEGIGPKIADVLRAQGIRTFEQLAATPVARLHEILEAAGPRFKIANRPDTWPRQSDLCAKGQWEALRAYQDQLTDGVDRRNKPSGPSSS